VSHYCKLYFLVLLLMVTTMGCAAGNQVDDGPEMVPEEIPDGRPSNDWEDMAFETVDQDNLQGNLKEKFYGDHFEQKMMIAEDSGYKYIFVSAGRKPTAGYSIRVGSLVGFEKLIVLNTLLYSPCESDTVETIATYPTLLIRIEADDREVIHFLTDTRNTYLG
jgi:hypothetical protein